MIKEFPYKIDPRLKRKLDLLVKNLDKKDVWIMVDGDEGSGKTNTLAYLIYYFHCATGREINLDRLYFDSKDMFEWAKDHENGLIGWDEMAMGGLSTEWYSKAQTNLMKFAMMGRKKHHIFIMCVPRFDKIREELRRDRIHALIHMDLGRKMDNWGHYHYITRRGVKMLNGIWKNKKKRQYKQSALACNGFLSNIDIPYVFPEVFDSNKYEKMKDEAISSIGVKPLSTQQAKWLDQRNKLITYLKKDKGLSEIKMERLLNSIGIDIKKSQINNLIPTIH